MNPSISTAASSRESDAGDCLLLVPWGFDAPPEMLEGLRRRGMTIREVSDAPSVMVELARRACSGLVVIEPAALTDFAALVEAVRRYYPGVRGWSYDGGTEPRLRRWGDAPILKREAPPSVQKTEASAAWSDVRLSEEELAMLLTDVTTGAATESGA